MPIARIDDETAATMARVKLATIRQWIRRGHLTRHHDGIDVYELDHWLTTTRNMDKARGAILATHQRHQTRRAS